MKLLSRISPTQPTESRYSLDDYMTWVSDQGWPTLQTTYQPGQTTETVIGNYMSHAATLYKANGPIFALVAFKIALFSQVRWSYRQLRKGRGGDLFSLPELDVLNNDPILAVYMMQDHDLAGNFYGVRESDRIRRLRPDYVELVGDKPLNRYDVNILGALYSPDGPLTAEVDKEFFRAEEVVHWPADPDPECKWRGMSWLQPIVKEAQADNAATAHKLKFFENGATPNLVVKIDKDVSVETFEKFKDKMEEGHAGVQNAYKTLYLGGGADATVVGADLRQLEFSVTQGKGESRLAAAARVPAVLAGFSEGLQAATYSNFGQARRAAADSLLHPLWVSAAAALSNVITPQPGAQLWYDARDIPFLREDAKDDAEIKAQEAVTIRQLVDAGFEPDSIIAAVQSGDWSLLVHSGLFSVQLQPPTAGQLSAPSANGQTAPDMVPAN